MIPSAAPSTSNYVRDTIGELKVGDKIEIEYHHKKAQFRVTWIAACEGSLEKQIGAECMEPGKQVLGVKFPEQRDEYEEQE
jgi:hypothetical protein